MAPDNFSIDVIANKLFGSKDRERIRQGYLDYVIEIKIKERYVELKDYDRQIYLYPDGCLYLDDEDIVVDWSQARINWD